MPAVERTDDESTIQRVLARAAECLRAGRIVAFPTETVYGLGASALDAAAVRRVFAAKGRPATNPLIVHVAGVDEARRVVADWPAVAQSLAERFWPGPLTLVLPRGPAVVDEVTAGGTTVAVRSPAHPVAQALLRACGLPLAAPSANRSTEVSPTTAQHVLQSLGDRVDMVIDGGPCPGGIESTVVDITCDPPRLLRPGLVTVTMLEAVVGRVRVVDKPTAGPARSPGMMERHYAPRTPLELAGTDRVVELLRQQQRVAWVTHTGVDIAGTEVRRLPSDAAGYAARLYAALHDLDATGVAAIVVEPPPAGDDWLAVRDRLQRAARG